MPAHTVLGLDLNNEQRRLILEAHLFGLFRADALVHVQVSRGDRSGGVGHGGDHSGRNNVRHCDEKGQEQPCVRVHHPTEPTYVSAIK